MNGLKIRVLVADDDPTIVDLYSERLQAEGFEVIIAKNGQEMLARAIEEKPDIMLLDLKMPQVNGLDGLDIVKNTSEIKGIPVIVLTAFANPEFKDRAMKSGVVDYLIKSEVTPGQVAQKIKDILNK